MTLRNRIEALERRLAYRNTPQLIEIKGGLPDEAHMHASAGKLYFEQADHETLAAFRARALAAAKATGEPFLVFGGLPTLKDQTGDRLHPEQLRRCGK
jgi:hypothetical protein